MPNYNAPFLNIDFLFLQILYLFRAVGDFLFAFFSAPSWAVIQGYSLLLEIFLIPALIYSIYKLTQLRRREKEAFLAIFEANKEGEKKSTEWWDDIVDHIDTENEAQWKLALIDADKILEDALRSAGYSGVGVGELLKDAEDKHGFKTLQEAWEAHKVRNRIAHESGFQLSKHDAKNSVERYRKVFEEFGYL